MKQIRTCLLAVCISLVLLHASAQELPFATYTGLFPVNLIDLGTLNENQVIKATLTILKQFGTSTISLDIYKDNLAGTKINLPLAAGSTQDYTVTLAQGAGGRYYLKIIDTANTGIFQYRVNVYADDVLIKTGAGSVVGDSDAASQILTISNTCKAKLYYTGPPGHVAVYDKADLTATPIFFSVDGSSPLDLTFTDTTAKDYYILLDPVPFVPDIPYQPYTVRVTTFCSTFCSSAANPVAPTCYFCGDGILNDGEQCDNGNQPGCVNCITSPGYNCYGNLLGTSICNKFPFCGDAIVDQGEQCDNGNRLGCSTGCVPDTGYNCTAVINKPSVCSFCGNGIVETGEACDNGNLVGCSVNCTVDPGFLCRGNPSMCYKANPVCGNKIIEVAEGCDDGNLVNGDGCNSYCVVEAGWTCDGQMGQLSACNKTSPARPVCGNNIYEPTVNATYPPESIGGFATNYQYYWAWVMPEQCDNGNQPGCINCVIQQGWQCLNTAGQPSKCFVNVVAPTCGNGVFEPALGEQCDDGNVNNGDGCSALCHVEYPWYCFDNKRCLNPLNPASQPQFIAAFCGNGIVETQFGEVCDDGNKVSADGCSSSCKPESGWNCQTPATGATFCVKNLGVGFCGNGLVEGGEQCDDGFPLMNGDGCTVTCQIEPGWNCYFVDYRQVVSRCFRKPMSRL